MTDTDGLLRDAGGARPRDELDALIERLKGFNPPDRTIASQRDYSQAIYDAAAALVQLRDENARLLSDPMNVGWQRAQDAIKDRAAAVSQWKAAIEWQDCALVMQTERDAWKSKLLAEEVEHDATMAERDALRQKLDGILKAYDAYRARGMIPAPNQYALLVAAIDAAREKP